MSKLEKAKKIAIRAHKNQFDKAGAPYILHPIHVMNSVKTIEEKIVAVLHDVVEDTDITLEYLKSKGFNDRIINAIDCLTHRKDESYESYIKRVSSNKISVIVKMADLKHNMDLSRLETVGEEDIKRRNKYVECYNYLVNLV